MRGVLDLNLLLSVRTKPEGWAASPALGSRGATGAVMLLTRLVGPATKSPILRVSR